MSDDPPPPPPSLQPPPGYAGFEDNYASGVRDIRNVGGLSRWVIALPIVAAVAMLAGVMLSFGVQDDAEAFLDGSISEDDFLDRYAGASLLQGAGTLPFIAAAVVTLIYCYRIAQNHRSLGRGTTWSPGLAAGGWFLPPILFVIPMLMLHEAWKASEPSSPPGDDRWKQSGASPLVFVWWALFGIVPLAFIPSTLRRFNSFSPNARDLAEMVTDGLTLQLISNVVQVAAAAAWAVLIVQLTARHRQFTGEARR